MINIVQQCIMYDKRIVSIFVRFILHKIVSIVIVKNAIGTHKS